MPDALFTVSSRSAGCCRSHRRRIIINWPAELIPPKLRHAVSATRSCVPKSNGSGTRTIKSTGSVKPGIIRKAWHQLKREGFEVARCTIDRLMKQIGIRGAVRGKIVKTTVPDTSAPCPHDKVNRIFRAPEPNLLWVSDFTYVSTWQGFVYVAFVIDTFADRIVGWRVSRSAKTDFVLDALEQALHDRRPVQKGGLIHHSDRGGQYLSIRYTERLAEAGIEPSVGSVGDSYDNALAETINGLYKTELIHRQGPWRNMQDLEMATLVRHCARTNGASMAHGRLVQQPPTTWTHRKHPASRG